MVSVDDLLALLMSDRVRASDRISALGDALLIGRGDKIIAQLDLSTGIATLSFEDTVEVVH